MTLAFVLRWRFWLVLSAAVFVLLAVLDRPASALLGPSDCNSSAYSYFFSGQKSVWSPLVGSSAAGGYSYVINPNGLPQGSSTAQQLIYGHKNWNQTNNDCGIGNQNNFDAVFNGENNVQAGAQDGINAVDFSTQDPPLGCSAGAIACTVDWAYVYSSGPNEIHEADMRFDLQYSWDDGQGPCILAYNEQSVATHEAGHALGLGHVSDSTQTMYSQSNFCDTSPQTIGSGDILGMRSLYP